MNYYAGVAYVTILANQMATIDFDQLNMRWNDNVQFEHITTHGSDNGDCTKVVYLTTRNKHKNEMWLLNVRDTLSQTLPDAFIAVASRDEFDIPNDFWYSENYPLVRIQDLSKIAFAISDDLIKKLEEAKANIRINY